MIILFILLIPAFEAPASTWCVRNVMRQLAKL